MCGSDCFSMADEMWGQPTGQGFACCKAMLKGRLGALSGNANKGHTESMTKHWFVMTREWIAKLKFDVK